MFWYWLNTLAPSFSFMAGAWNSRRTDRTIVDRRTGAVFPNMTLCHAAKGAIFMVRARGVAEQILSSLPNV